MATNGILKFQGTNKATFVGATSNVVIDTVKSSLGIGVDVNGPTSNLHVVGNVYVSTELTVGGTVTATTFAGDGSGLTGISTSSTLQSVTDTGNVTSNTIQFTNATTGLVATGNVHALKFIGDGSELTGISTSPTLQSVTDTGNVTSNTIQFTNATTGFIVNSNSIVTGNVTAATFLGDGSGLTSIPAAQITGTLDAARIPDLDTAKITTGTLAVANGGTGVNGSTGTGDVVLSIAPAFSGDVAFDTDTLKIDSTNNRVGVGTASPGHKIDVLTYTANDGIRIQGGSKFALLTSNLSLASYNGLVNAGDSGIIFSTDNNPYSDSGTNGFVIAPWTTLHSGGLKISETGNVGIGTTSPTQKLDVNGVIKSNVPSWNMWDAGTISSGILNFTTHIVPAQNCSTTLSTGRVTATVAGRYFASFHGFTESNVPAGTGCSYDIRKNGASVIRNYHYQPVSNYSALGGITVIMDLAVNDYVDVSTNFAVHHSNAAGFCGFMIG